MKILQFTVLKDNEVRKIFNSVTYGENIEIDKEDDIDKKVKNMFNYDLVILGLGDNNYPTNFIIDDLISYNQSGGPIMITHGINPFDTIEIEEGFYEHCKTCKYYIKKEKRLLEKCNDLGISPDSLEGRQHQYYDHVDVIIDHQILHSPFNITKSDFNVKQTHTYGIGLIPECIKILNPSSLPDDKYAYHLSIYEPIGRGKIAFFNTGHNEGDFNNKWNGLPSTEEQLFCNVVNWLIT